MPYQRPMPEPDSRSKPNPEGKRPGTLDAWVQAEKYIQIILVLPSAAFIGWLLGAWLDHLFRQVWISMAGIVLGIVAGLVAAVRMAIYYTAKSGNGDGTSSGTNPQS